MLVRLEIMFVLSSLLYSCNVERDMRGKVQTEGRTTESAYELKESDYTNNKILKDVTGRLYVLNNIEESEFVMVKWNNGYKSFGVMRKGKEYGKWYLYDNKNRLKKCSTYSKDGSFISTLERFNKKGETIYFKHGDSPF